jgi:hypothetical protein
MSGDEVAARARGRYANSRGDSAITGAIPSHGGSRRANQPYAYGEEDDRHLRYAVPGED